MLGLSKILRMGEGRAVKRLAKIADQVMDLDEEYTELTDEELQAKTDELKTVSYTHLTLPTILLV